MRYVQYLLLFTSLVFISCSEGEPEIPEIIIDPSVAITIDGQEIDFPETLAENYHWINRDRDIILEIMVILAYEESVNNLEITLKEADSLSGTDHPFAPYGTSTIEGVTINFEVFSEDGGSVVAVYRTVDDLSGSFKIEDLDRSGKLISGTFQGKVLLSNIDNGEVSSTQEVDISGQVKDVVIVDPFE